MFSLPPGIRRPPFDGHTTEPMIEKSKPNLWSRALPKFVLSRWTWHPLTLFILATFATTASGIWVWHTHESELLDRRAFQLSWEKIRATPQPDYLSTDLKKVAFDGSRLAELNLLDHDVVKKIHAAFAVQSWVERVSVRKNRYAIDVGLIYRQPVALVEFGDNLLLPVDRNGVVLDGGQLNQDITSRYLRISVRSPQVGTIVNGDAWPDPRIVAAAMIAELVRPHAQEWGISRVSHVPLDENSVAAEGDFEFLTAQGPAGIRVMWGSPPGFERPGEAMADKKLAVLEQWISERGSLNDVGTSQSIDLRAGQIQLVGNQ